jgi:hypothetical protein
MTLDRERIRQLERENEILRAATTRGATGLPLWQAMSFHTSLPEADVVRQGEPCRKETRA